MARKLNSRLGLIVGLSPAAGMYYYRRLVRTFATREQPLNAILAHADLSTVFKYADDGNLDSLARYVASWFELLERAGCGIGAISAVMPHVCIDEIRRRTRLPIVDLLTSLRNDLERRKIGRICLLGTKRVMRSALFGSLHDFEIVRLEEHEIQRVDATYTRLALRGHGTAEDRAFFNRLAGQLAKRERLDGVVLAGTDLSALFEESPARFTAIDAANVHIDAIAERL